MFIFCGFYVFGYSIIEFSWTLQRVPITERRRLHYVPSLIEGFFNDSEHKVPNCSLGSESPIMQGSLQYLTICCALADSMIESGKSASSTLQVSKRSNIASVFTFCTEVPKCRIAVGRCLERHMFLTDLWSIQTYSKTFDHFCGRESALDSLSEHSKIRRCDALIY